MAYQNPNKVSGTSQKYSGGHKPEGGKQTPRTTNRTGAAHADLVVLDENNNIAKSDDGRTIQLGSLWMADNALNALKAAGIKKIGSIRMASGEKVALIMRKSSEN